MSDTAEWVAEIQHRFARAAEAVSDLRNLPPLPTPATDDAVKELVAMRRYSWQDLQASDSGTHGLGALSKIVSDVLTAAAKSGRSAILLHPGDLKWVVATDDDGSRFAVTPVMDAPAGSSWKFILPANDLFDSYFRWHGEPCLVLESAAVAEGKPVNPWHPPPWVVKKLPDWVLADDLIKDTRRRRDVQREREKQDASPPAQARREKEYEIQRRLKLHEPPAWFSGAQRR
jgi:hypothetical protein